MNNQRYVLLFSIGLFLFFGWMAWEAASFTEKARYFPYYISITATVLTFFNVLINIRVLLKQKAQAAEVIREQEDEEISEPVLRYILWVVGFIVVIILIGFLPATVLFLLTFLYIETGYGILKAFVGTAAALTFILLFSSYMTIYWPSGIFPIWPI